MSDHRTLVPAYGGWNQCISVLEQTANVSHLIRISHVIDSEFGSDSTATTESLMTRVIEVESKELTALSGYAHLLIAEQMNSQGFDKVSINRELEKAEALLDYAHLGGRHPWLPRAQRLKRRVNLRDYLKLGITIFSLLTLFIIIGIVYNFIQTSDTSFF
jgi:hypothetical protein